MAKSKTPSYTIEFKLAVEPFQAHLLERYLESARVVYNICLSIALKRSNALKQHKPYQALIKEPNSKQRREALKQMRLDFGFSEYQLHAAVVGAKKHFLGLGINEAQKLATRAFQAVEKNITALQKKSISNEKAKLSRLKINQIQPDFAKRKASLFGTN